MKGLPTLQLSQSLKLRLPLLIVCLLAAVIVVFGIAAQRQLRRVFEQGEALRLQRASEQMVAMLDASVGRQQASIGALAADSVVRAALLAPTVRNIAAAHVLLQRVAPSSARISRTIWTSECVPVVTTGSGSAPVSSCDGALGGKGTARRARTGLLLRDADSVSYVTVAPVRGTGDVDASVIGYVAELLRLSSGAAARTLGQMVGEETTILLGNENGSLWTDMSRPIEALVRPSRGEAALFETPEGERYLGVARSLRAAPWVVLVRTPLSIIDAPERGPMTLFGEAALACLLFGALGAWFLGRHVTAPLARLTEGAQALAAGDYQQRVSDTRRDEIGHLVYAFNDLSKRLGTSNAELRAVLAESTQSREEAVASRTLLEDVLRQARVGLALFDRDLRYVQVSQLVGELHGVPVEDHYGKRPGDVLPQLAVKEGVLREVLATGVVKNDQHISVALPGKAARHWVANCFPMRDPGGQIIGVGAILLDTTTLESLEAQLQHSQKLEAVGRLAGGIAHDFNNLLTVITSYSALVLETTDAGDIHDDLTEIQNAANRAAGLTRQLLAFSRKQHLQPQAIDLNKVAREMERMLVRLIGADVDLVLDLDPSLDEAFADPGQVEQVIMNLAVNARDAMPEGGRLTIATSSESAVHDNSQLVLLTVSDTGTGMDEETRRQIFEPFFTTKESGKGTGLGLSTVHGIVKQSRGEIVVESVVGVGTTFLVYLPRATSGATAERTVMASNGQSLTGRETVLLASDDKALQQLAARVLRNGGYAVMEASSAEDAAEIADAQGGKIALLLADVMMPKLSGQALAQRLVSRHRGVRVLLMSGHTQEDVESIVGSRAHFLQKPFSPQQLLHAVRAALDDALVVA